MVTCPMCPNNEEIKGKYKVIKSTNISLTRIFCLVIEANQIEGDLVICQKCFVNHLKKTSASKKSRHEQLEVRINGNIQNQDTKIEKVEKDPKEAKDNISNINTKVIDLEKEKNDYSYQRRMIMLLVFITFTSFIFAIGLIKAQKFINQESREKQK